MLGELKTKGPKGLLVLVRARSSSDGSIPGPQTSYRAEYQLSAAPALDRSVGGLEACDSLSDL